ncbi:putative cyclin-D7-1 [Ananas comosus]|uniref:Putative cyclin-D7-1 n=1 Tax=Ananas comosus TaxID=4615 RepID=A0A199UU09_ANACO|nr:putative cyclin-D7-1 [Ananas comosus]
MTENDSGIELLCDEDPFVYSRSPSPTPTRQDILQFRSLDKNQKLSEEERREAFSYFLSKEQQFAPNSEYLKQLQCSANLSSARFKAVRYIILVCSKLSLAVGTVFNAANYVDRFLSMNSSTNWEGWMLELLSVACVSIAAKFDEVNIPSLHDLQLAHIYANTRRINCYMILQYDDSMIDECDQTEEMEHRFQASTTQDMELMILKALDWRLSCVTPFSYVDLLLPLSRQHTEGTTSADCVTRLLLLSLLGTSLLQFGAFVVSASAFRCALQDNDGASFSDLNDLIPLEHMVKLEECYEIMKQIWDKKKTKKNNNRSPVSVIPVENGDHALGCNLRINRCLFTEPISEDDFNEHERKDHKDP